MQVSLNLFNHIASIYMIVSSKAWLG
jgi:hypothetical protein